MKHILRIFILNIIALKTITLVLPSIHLAKGLETFLLTALALTIFEYLLKPIARILFLPINILTLGTLRWVINVISLYLVSMFIEGFSISPYHFLGSNWNGFIIPPIRFSLLATYVIISLLINLIITLLRWAFKR